MLAQGVTNITDANGHITAVQITWFDPAKGTQTFQVSSLPATLNTAADVTNYFNANVGTLNGQPQTRLGQFFGCFALVNVTAYSKRAWVDMQAVFSDEAPIPADYFAP